MFLLVVGLLFRLNSFLFPVYLILRASVVNSQVPATRVFLASNHGTGQCPDLSSSPPLSIVSARSNLDCARICSYTTQCLHYSFRRSDRSCALFADTPKTMMSVQDCSLFLDPRRFEGCFCSVFPLTDPNACSLPFQFGEKEFYGCMSVSNSTPQCLLNNGTVAQCVTPIGFVVVKGFVNLGAVGPLPCISNWIIVMQRLTGDVDFYRNWTDYKNGFGSETDFWIGNEKIHQITTGKNYTLRIEVQTYSSQNWYHADYARFWMDSEAKWYALHLLQFSGDAGDGFTDSSLKPRWYNNGMNFTTFDGDNDQKVNGNCAIQFTGAWWFNDCWWSCLTCPYGSINFSWYPLAVMNLENYGKLRAARMMIRST